MAWVFNPFTGNLDSSGTTSITGATTLDGLSDVNVTEGAGIDGKFLKWDNATSKWVAASASVSPGGSDTQVQFNDGGSTFGGSTGLTFNKTTKTLTLTSGAIALSSSTINKLTLTQPANGATLTIVDGKTLTASNSLTLAGTDGTTMTFPGTSGTVATLNYANLYTKAQTFQPDSDAQAGTFRRYDAAQTANIVEIQTEANAFLAAFDKLGALTIGAASGNTGAMKLKGTTSGTVTVTTADAAGTWTLKLPTSGGSNGQYLQTDGSGNTSWQTVSASATLTVNSTATSGGAAGQIMFDDGSKLQESSSLVWDNTAKKLTVTGLGTGGSTALLSLSVSGGSFGLSGDISANAWTTSGIRYANASAILTDKTSSGTVAAAYTDVFGGNTIAASNSTTFTDYATTYINGPTAGTNVTFTNAWALRLGGGLKFTTSALANDASNVLALRNSTSPQTLLIYGTADGAPGSNYARLSIAASKSYSGGVYHVISAEYAGTGAANQNIVIQPLGTGAIMARLPDGTNSNGNARGTNAVDLQIGSGAATQVASGDRSFAAGYGNTVSAQYASAIGYANTSSGQGSFASGQSNTASASSAFAAGGTATASQNYAVAFSATASAISSTAFQENAVADKVGQFAVGARKFANNGDAQWSVLPLKASTTDATETEMTLLGAGTSYRPLIPNNTTWHVRVYVVARTATAGAKYGAWSFEGLLTKGTTAGSTALVGAAAAINKYGSNAGDVPAGWVVTVTADTTNGGVFVKVTGEAATNIRWVAKMDLVEVGFA